MPPPAFFACLQARRPEERVSVSAHTHHRLRLLAGLLILLAAHLMLRGYVTDDTYIHLRYAENVAERGQFAFNPGENTYGATSPLWIFGLVLLLKLGVTGPVAAWALGLASGALALGLLAGLLRRLAFPEHWRWWIFLLVAVDAWFLRWTMSGMETPLATASLLALLWPLVMPTTVTADPEARRPLWPRYLGWGVAAGLAALVRPEFLLLGPAALLPLLLFEYRRGDRIAGAPGRFAARPHTLLAAAAGGWLATVGPWLVYAQVTFGRWTPGTASAKSNDLVLAPLEILSYAARSLVQLATTQGVLWMAFGLLIVLVMGERLRQQRRGDAGHTEDVDSAWHYWQAVGLVLIVMLWVGLLVGGYAVKRVWTISRYLSPLSAPVLLMMGVLAYWLLHMAADFRGRRLLRRQVAALACAATVAINVGVLGWQVRPHARDFSAGVVACYLEKGVWIGEHSRPEDIIAALDIGALAYGSDRHVLDLMGLVSPEILDMGRQMGFHEMVESGIWLRSEQKEGRVPAWFVDRTEGPPRWDGHVIRGVAFELVDTCTIHGVGLTEPQDWTVAIYRLGRVGGPGPAPGS
jgi:hypothetical protein